MCEGGFAPPQEIEEDCLTVDNYYHDGDLWIFNDDGLVYRTIPTVEDVRSVPLILAKEDVTGDSLPDILTIEQSCTMYPCSPNYHLITAHDNHFRSYRFSLLDSLVRLRDENNDGILDVFLDGGTYNILGAGPQRSEMITMAWDGYDFVEYEHTISPIRYRYHALLEANKLFAQEEYDEAAEWYTLTFEDDGLADYWSDDERPITQQYAAFCLAALSLYKENLEDVQQWQTWLETNHAESPFFGGTQQLLTDWGNNYDAILAYETAVTYLFTVNEEQGCRREFGECLWREIYYMDYANDHTSLKISSMCKSS